MNFGYRCFGLYRYSLTYGTLSRSFIHSSWDTLYTIFYRKIVCFTGGYNYYSTEKMYSGINGCEMKADIFFGIVHYQRLRHMVSDKWQVRPSASIYDPCYIWQILCVISCWVTYDINISHLTDCPHAWQEVTSSVCQVKHGLCIVELRW